MVAVGELAHTLNLNGGLNLVDPPAEIQDNQLLVADNLWYLNDKLCKRPGFFREHNTSVGSTQLIILGYNSLNFKYLVATYNSTGLYEVDAGVGTTPTTVTISGGASITQNPSWMLYVAGTTYVGFNGTMGVRTLVGGVLSAATIANAPQSDFGVYHKGRIFTNVYNSPGRIAFSDPITPTAPVATWQTTNIIDIDTSGKDIITGMASLGDLLLIFFRHSTWTMYVQGTSPADWVVRRIHNVIGAAPSRASASIFVHGNNVYFISQDGVYQTNGSSFTNLAEKIWNPLADKFRINYNIGISGHWRITAWHETLIVCGHHSGGGFCYTYDLKLGAWTTWSFLGDSSGFFDFLGGASVTTTTFQVMASFTTGGNNRIYSSSDNAAANYDAYLGIGLNTFTDDLLSSASSGTGTAYDAAFKTKEFQTELDRFIRVKWAGLEYRSYYTPVFGWVSDNVSALLAGPGFDSTRSKGYKVRGPGRCRSFSLTGLSGLPAPWEMDRVVLHVTGKPKLRAKSNV